MPKSRLKSSEIDIRFGIQFREEVPNELAEWLDYVEYTIRSLDDVKHIPESDKMCFAHAPDPQEEGWIVVVK